MARPALTPGTTAQPSSSPLATAGSGPPGRAHPPFAPWRVPVAASVAEPPAASVAGEGAKAGPAAEVRGLRSQPPRTLGLPPPPMTGSPRSFASSTGPRPRSHLLGSSSGSCGSGWLPWPPGSSSSSSSSAAGAGAGGPPTYADCPAPRWAGRRFAGDVTLVIPVVLPALVVEGELVEGPRGGIGIVLPLPWDAVGFGDSLWAL